MVCRQTREGAEVRARGTFYQQMRTRSTHRFKEPGRAGARLDACYYCGMSRADASAQKQNIARAEVALRRAAIAYARAIDAAGEDPAGVDAGEALRRAAVDYYDARGQRA